MTRRRVVRGALVAFVVTLAAGCEPALPDPDSQGATVLRERCGGCHRIYAPGSMTAEMWGVQVEQMRDQFARRGIPWLTTEEEGALRAYLSAHAGG
ncbi:MAG TPA: hypothetical protein VLI07_04365 [Candidatus Binatus sp.]|nr:hypothetical protein [Candidatus Binatus sp.]